VSGGIVLFFGPGGGVAATASNPFREMRGAATLCGLPALTPGGLFLGLG